MRSEGAGLGLSDKGIRVFGGAEEVGVAADVGEAEGGGVGGELEVAAEGGGEFGGG